MKVLTLTQPWATLVSIGAKKFVTRSWGTAYCGRLALHAAKGFPKWARDTCFENDHILDTLVEHGIDVPDLPLGQTIAVCHLVSAVPIEKSPWVISEREAAFGDYRAGRFVWYLDDVRRLPEPIPARGKLGLWTFDHPMLDVHATVPVTPLACTTCTPYITPEVVYATFETTRITRQTPRRQLG